MSLNENKKNELTRQRKIDKEKEITKIFKPDAQQKSAIKPNLSGADADNGHQPNETDAGLSS